MDYAHTPDALENVLKTIRDIVGKDAEVITVAGCGGDRDALKRPEMAEIACKYSSKVILTAAKENLWRVIVTENPKRGTWTLSVWYGDTQIFDLGITTVRARFKFDKPNDWDTKNIYVVFIDKDGKSLKAFPAKYDAITEELVFDSSLVGEFVVVQFDYQGELYSKGFYDELAKLDAVRHLVDLHNGKVK